MNPFAIACVIFLTAALPSARCFAAEGARDSSDFLNACVLTSAQKMHLKSSIPEHLRSLFCSEAEIPQSSDLSYVGPNCFTAVKLWYEPSAPREYVSGEHFSEFLDAFAEVSEHEVRLGDIVAFERKDLQFGDRKWFSHGAVFIGQGMVWNKLGPSKFSDRGNGLKFESPDWTVSSVSALLEVFDSTTAVYFRKK